MNTASCVKISHGLGNQLFQYCIYEMLRREGIAVTADLSFFTEKHAYRDYLLEEVFGLKLAIAAHEDFQAHKEAPPIYLGNRRKVLLQVAWRKYVEREKLHLKEIGFHFFPGLSTIARNAYLEGFWQSYRYFSQIDDEIRKGLAFQRAMTHDNAKTAELIGSCNAVSVHYRRGDYTRSARFGNICDAAYYAAAIEHMAVQLDDPVFFLFSDDTAWLKENIELQHPHHIVDCRDDPTGAEDMRLMSLCKSNIIANSTYSWWGAWLNNHKDKIVVAPKRWANLEGDHEPEIIPGSWIRVGD